MPMNGNDKPIQTNDAQAIHDILSKILMKWRKAPPSSFSRQHVKGNDSPQRTNQTPPDSHLFEDDHIIKETVLLTPEDFLAESHTPTTFPEKEIPETRCVTLEKGGASETPEPIRQTGEDVPKTVVQAFDIPKPEGPSLKEPPEKHIPETVVFSTQGISEANIRHKQQEGVSPPTTKAPQKKKEPEAVKNPYTHVPETIVFKNGKTKK